MSDITRSCTACGSTLAAADRQCRECGEATPLRRQSLFRIVTSAAAANTANEGEDAGAVVIISRDFMQLEELACLRLDRDDPVARRLREKLDRSRVVPPGSVPPGTVTLGSRVLFSVDRGPVESRVLVLPDGHALYGWSLPVTTPRGLAMLGLRAGATALAERRDGGVERLAIRAVAYQPDDRRPGCGAPTGGGGRCVPDGPDDSPDPPAA